MYFPTVATPEGRASTAIRSRCALDPTLDSLAPSVGSAPRSLSESVAARVAISTATTGGSPLDASESAFRAGRLPTQIVSQTSATEVSAPLGWPHRLASDLRRVPDTRQLPT